MSKHLLPSSASKIKLCPLSLIFRFDFGFSSLLFVFFNFVLQETNDQINYTKKSNMELRLPQPGGKSALNKFSVSRDVTEKCTHYEKVATSCLIFFQTNQNVEEKNKLSILFLFSLFLHWSCLIIKAVSSLRPIDCHVGLCFLLKTSPLSANPHACSSEPLCSLSPLGC